MSLAFAVKFSELEADLTLVSGETKECYDCDQDNPRAVLRETCASCGGTGRQPLAASEIADELRTTKTGGQDRGSGGGGGGGRVEDSDDLLLEY